MMLTYTPTTLTLNAQLLPKVRIDVEALKEAKDKEERERKTLKDKPEAWAKKKKEREDKLAGRNSQNPVIYLSQATISRSNVADLWKCLQWSQVRGGWR
jgi:hypothetical protein